MQREITTAVHKVGGVVTDLRGQPWVPGVHAEMLAVRREVA
ncbi:hypothetical protein Val02_36050 [Virgisporangium aliadipatigenens]|uniref:Uncharacterized protein n=1 Tax=Virgisporangium aliadipatigenens TaxID=741659 RepID=A0A8J4DQK8_9ACTN|nr:hypothetical protein [Virgisporangium aliadipatigenens]GIJ46719.1 hypothetical protein Val02_36050 [Virgisporangium aliadipatigenens]